MGSATESQIRKPAKNPDGTMLAHSAGISHAFSLAVLVVFITQSPGIRITSRCVHRGVSKVPSRKIRGRKARLQPKRVETRTT